MIKTADRYLKLLLLFLMAIIFIKVIILAFL